MLFCSRLKRKAQAGPEVGLYSFPRGSSRLTYRRPARACPHPTPAPARTSSHPPALAPVCQASLPPSLARLPVQAGLSLKLQQHIGALAGMGFCCPSGLHPPRCGRFHSFLLGAASPQRTKPLEPFSLFSPSLLNFTSMFSSSQIGASFILDFKLRRSLKAFLFSPQLHLLTHSQSVSSLDSPFPPTKPPKQAIKCLQLCLYYPSLSVAVRGTS